MKRRDTKRAILMEALHLFSVHGYDGVTVKEIAGAVGIRDSSLYKHYRSKQEIFDSLLEEMRRHFGKTVSQYRLPAEEMELMARQYLDNDLSFLQGVCKINFLFFLRDPLAVAYRRMLQLERYRNPVAAAALRDFFLETPMGYHQKLFAAMQCLGAALKGDPAVLALEFYAPFWYLLDCYDSRPELEAEALERLSDHVRQFWHTHIA